MRAVIALLAKIAPTSLYVILTGETGTGKELAARAMHDGSPRAAKSFVIVDCAAVSPTLVESELFGHERGAFTGADRARPGAFELADGATLFLDEIGELPLDLQAKLLRALERGEVKRLGASKHAEVDVRVVAATHRDLPEMVEAGRFREDLYFRLAEVVVELPPLRARDGDLAYLAERILDEERAGSAPAKRLAPDALDALARRTWPGNVRELRNVLRRAAALATGDHIRVSDLAAPPRSVPPPPPATPRVTVSADVPLREARDRAIADVERTYLEQMLERFGGDLDRVAEAAGLHRKSVERLIRQHGLRAGRT
jgi:DNA-binding NtrC family response regulator